MSIKINNNIGFNEISGKYTKCQKVYNIKQLKFESNQDKEIQFIEIPFPLEYACLEYHIHQKNGPCEVRSIDRHTEDQSDKVFVKIEKDSEYFIKLTYDGKKTIHTFINFSDTESLSSESENDSSESGSENNDTELEEKISKL